MAKIPNLVQQPVGEFALGNIPTPDYMGPAKAFANLLDTVQDIETVGGIDEATGEAAKELSELRAILVNSNTLEADFVGDEYDVEQHTSISDGKGGRIELPKPMIFTHEVANDLWAKRSQEIVDHYAGTITNTEARNKFLKEVNQRYVAPGGAEVMGSNIIRARAYGQARAERAIEDIIASIAPREERESEAKSVIARQALLGADPVWIERRLASLGPDIDQMDVQNDIIGATTIDEIDQIEETMWAGGTRMAPETMRTMSAQMDKRRADFEKANVQRQTENADQMFGMYVDGLLTEQQVGIAVSSDEITHADGWQFLNAFKSGGSTAKASDPLVLSKYRGAIQVIQYTGNQHRVLQRQQLLRLTITRAAMGLNPNGTPSGLPARITGADAFTLNAQLDKAVEDALENNEYDKALQSLTAWTRVNVDLVGQVYAGIGGNQNTVDAAIAFKEGLDAYMDQFGADAKPQEYFDANKDAFNPNNFEEGINKEFRDQIPQSDQFMTKSTGFTGFTFTEEGQNRFVRWMGSTGAATLDPAEFERISVLFDQYYRGRGIAPAGGRLQLEPNDPLYTQFEALTQ
jgi:hypothetical protein